MFDVSSALHLAPSITPIPHGTNGFPTARFGTSFPRRVSRKSFSATAVLRWKLGMGWNPIAASRRENLEVMDLPPSPPVHSGHPFKIILGSSSSSRRLILEEMGYQFTVMTADIDEKAIRMEKPEELVMTLAEAKADAILAKLKGTNEDYAENDDGQPTLLITADQVVVHEGIIREKPSSKEEARQFVKSYSNGCASTVGSVLVTNLKTGIKKGACDTAEVYFHEIPDKVTSSASDPKQEVKRLPGGKIKKKLKQEVVIEKIVRNKRKCVTVVKGLELFGVKLSDASKKLGKKFATGASVVKGPTDKEQIDVQGDIFYDIVDFITNTWPDVPGNAIYFIEDGRKVVAV